MGRVGRVRVASAVLGLLVLPVVALSASGCRSAEPVPQVVKVGLIGSFEGLYRSAGYEALYAVKQAIAEQNAAGGIAGRPVELVALDDSGSDERAVTQPQELAQDPAILGVVGHTETDTTDAALGQYEGLSLPIVVPTTWLRAAPGAVFFVGASYWQEIIAALEAAGVPQGVTLALIPENGQWTAGAAEALSQWRVRTSKDPNGNEGFSGGISAVVLAESAAAAGEWLASAAVPDGVPVVGGSDLAGSVFAAMAGQATAAVWTGHVSVVAPPGDWDAFRQGYLVRAGAEAGMLAPVIYDAMRVLLDAMERAAQAGDLSRGGVARALRQTHWNGLTGLIEFDESGVRKSVSIEASRLDMLP